MALIVITVEEKKKQTGLSMLIVRTYMYFFFCDHVSFPLRSVLKKIIQLHNNIELFTQVILQPFDDTQIVVN